MEKLTFKQLTRNILNDSFGLVQLRKHELLNNNLFACRDISAIVKDYELSGRPDVMLAKGVDSPQIPYFCFHEYKQQTAPQWKR